MVNTSRRKNNRVKEEDQRFAIRLSGSGGQGLILAGVIDYHSVPCLTHKSGSVVKKLVICSTCNQMKAYASCSPVEKPGISPF